MIDYPFVGRYDSNPQKVRNDIQTLEQWASRVITTEEASARLAKNNHARVLTNEEFVELAHSLAYRR